MTTIHPSAVVDKDAQVSGDVEIGPFCVVGANVVLAPGVKLHSHVVVAGRTEIGGRLFQLIRMPTSCVTGRPATSARSLVAGLSGVALMWQVAHVGPTRERQAAGGVPITHFGEDSLGLWFHAKPGTISKRWWFPWSHNVSSGRCGSVVNVRELVCIGLQSTSS